MREFGAAIFSRFHSIHLNRRILAAYKRADYRDHVTQAAASSIGDPGTRFDAEAVAGHIGRPATPDGGLAGRCRPCASLPHGEIEVKLVGASLGDLSGQRRLCRVSLWQVVFPCRLGRPISGARSLCRPCFADGNNFDLSHAQACLAGIPPIFDGKCLKEPLLRGNERDKPIGQGLAVEGDSTGYRCQRPRRLPGAATAANKDRTVNGTFASVAPARNSRTVGFCSLLQASRRLTRRVNDRRR